MSNQMNSITARFLKDLSDMNDAYEESMSSPNMENQPLFKGAYNIRENGECVGRVCSENINIESKTDKPGLNITVKTAQKVRVYISQLV